MCAYTFAKTLSGDAACVSECVFLCVCVCVIPKSVHAVHRLLRLARCLDRIDNIRSLTAVQIDGCCHKNSLEQWTDSEKGG